MFAILLPSYYTNYKIGKIVFFPTGQKKLLNMISNQKQKEIKYLTLNYMKIKPFFYEPCFVKIKF